MFLVMNRKTGEFLRFTDRVSLGVLWVKSRDSAFKCDNPSLAFDIAQCHDCLVVTEE